MNRKKYGVTIVECTRCETQPLATKTEVAVYLRRLVAGLKPEDSKTIIIRRNK